MMGTNRTKYIHCNCWFSSLLCYEYKSPLAQLARNAPFYPPTCSLKFCSLRGLKRDWSKCPVSFKLGLISGECNAIHLQKEKCALISLLEEQSMPLRFDWSNGMCQIPLNQSKLTHTMCHSISCISGIVAFVMQSL